MSELSTVAIKDGHRGHLHHHHRDFPANNHMEAERADRISRLAGFDRLAAGRNTHAGSSNMSTAPSVMPTQAYFDANAIPQIVRERSTVGSASATTGSIHDGDENVSRTEQTGTSLWGASEGDGGSDGMRDDGDRMSEGDMDMEAEAGSSVGGFSDEGYAQSFGTPARAPGSAASPSAPHPARMPGLAGHVKDAKMMDGISYDKDVLDTVGRTPPPVED
jgi:hypothetical protein